MITRRHILRTLPAAAVAGALTACEKPEPPPRFILPKRPVAVVTTTVQAADLIREVGGDAVTVTSLIPPGENPHLWKPDAADLSAAQTADVFILSGLGLEANFKEDLDSLRKTGLVVAVLADALEEKDILRPGAGDAGAAPDPHFWMNFSLWAKAATKAAEALSEASKPAANYFKDRAHAYAYELQKLHESTEARFKEVQPRARFLFTSHDSMRYFGEAYGLSVRSLWGVQGADLPAESYKPLADWAKEHKVRVLFRENFADSEKALTRMHELAIPSGKIIVSLTLAKPGMLMAGLSEGLDAGRCLTAFKYTRDTILGVLIMVE